MKIITSDKITLGGFEKIQGIACRFQKTLNQNNALSAKYAGRSVAVGEANELGQKIPEALQKMKQCRGRCEIYSGDDSIFCEDFIKHFSLLLGGLCGIKQPKQPQAVQLTVSASQIKEALNWLNSLMEVVGCYNVSSQIQINKMNKQLEKQGIWR